eukprot:TRINITY_DN2861_c0_g2_i1.p1 TRINITY_DN2861_c0_g2~~TRINITY_DN2861_c0_g2_i1.p1  ORF type:complete len:648 (+),score=78.60 TRINITY_DN2861_c0_g2_i1:88-2031(+)
MNKSRFSPKSDRIGCSQDGSVELIPVEASFRFGLPLVLDTQHDQVLAWEFLRHTEQPFVFVALKNVADRSVRGVLYTFQGICKNEVRVDLRLDTASYISSSLLHSSEGILSVITLGQKQDQSPHVIPTCLAYDYKIYAPKPPSKFDVTTALPIHYDGMMIDGDNERIYMLGDRFVQETVHTDALLTLPGQQGSPAGSGQQRGFFSYSGDVIAVPEGNRVLFYRVPYIDDHQGPVPITIEQTPLVRTAFGKDGTFFAASTALGEIKILAHSHTDGKNKLVKLDRETVKPTTSSAPSAPLAQAPPHTIGSTVVSNSRPHIGSILQVKSWYDGRGNERSVFALGNSGTLVRMVDPPLSESKDMVVFTCDPVKNVDGKQRPFAFFLTPAARFAGLITPSGVYVVKHEAQGMFGAPTNKPNYLPPSDHAISCFDLHPTDANMRAMGTSAGAVVLEKKGGPKTTYPLFQDAISHMKFVDLRKTPRSSAYPGLAAIVATCGKKLGIRLLNTTGEAADKGQIISGWHTVDSMTVFDGAEFAGLDNFGHRTIAWAGNNVHTVDLVNYQLNAPWVSQRGNVTSVCILNSKFAVGATDQGDMFLLNIHERQVPELVGYIKTEFAPAYPTSITPWEGDIVALGLSNGAIVRLKIIHHLL